MTEQISSELDPISTDELLHSGSPPITPKNGEEYLNMDDILNSIETSLGLKSTPLQGTPRIHPEVSTHLSKIAREHARQAILLSIHNILKTRRDWKQKRALDLYLPTHFNGCILSKLDYATVLNKLCKTTGHKYALKSDDHMYLHVEFQFSYQNMINKWEQVDFF